MRGARSKSFRHAVALGGVLAATICFGMGIARVVPPDKGEAPTPTTLSIPPAAPEPPAPSGQGVLRGVYAGRWSAYCRAIPRFHEREDRLALWQQVSVLRAELNTHHRFRQYLLSSSVPSPNRTFARHYARYIRAQSRLVSAQVKASLSNDVARYSRAIQAQADHARARQLEDDLARRVKYCRQHMP
jgi:hypothetical protein